MTRNHRIGTAALLVSAFMLAPLVGAHDYEGPNPQDCPDDGRTHEHRYQDGSLYCRSSPSGCDMRVDGLSIQDPFVGEAFAGPVLVTTSAPGRNVAWEEPVVTVTPIDQTPTIFDAGPVVVPVTRLFDAEEARSSFTWAVAASTDARAFDVNFRTWSFDLDTGQVCEIEIEWRQRN